MIVFNGSNLGEGGQGIHPLLPVHTKEKSIPH